MKILILGGFLGSGKTTILLKLAEKIVSMYDISNGKIPLAIIENEIGDISVDGENISGRNFSVVDLFSGCICCSLSSDMTYAIKQLYEKINPEWIIIEATGLAYPDKIISTIKQYVPNVKSVKTIVVADASRWDELMDCMEIFVTGQIRSGNIILLNKIDIVDEDDIVRIKNDLVRINPEADVISMSAKKDIGDWVIALLGGTD